MVIPEYADVVVIGAGPAGAATATRLARAGVNVTLLDRAEFPREKACAEYCSPGVVDALEEIGALDRVIAREHRRLPVMRVVALGNEIPLDFSKDRAGGNLAMGIKRSVLDHELMSMAVDAGAQVLERTRVTGPILEDGRVAGVTVKTEQQDRTIRSEFVVAADGLSSTFCRTMGLERPVRWPYRLGLVARFDGLPAPVQAGQMHIGDGIYCGLSPVSETEANVALVVPMGSKLDGKPTGEFFDETIRLLPGISSLLGDAERLTRVRGCGPLGKRVRTVAGKGFLLVGDAAGFFDPLTGEGIHRALTGSKFAASAILRALNRDDRRPIGYRRARSRAFGDKQRVCQIIQALVSSPIALEYAASRASNRRVAAEQLRGVLGDYAPARQALQPGFLWQLLRP